MPMERVTDHWAETVSDFLLEQFKGAPNWQAVLKSVIDQYTALETEIWKLSSLLDFRCRIKSDVPTGRLLDFIASLCGVTRLAGESDADFYSRFIIEISSINAGTPDNVIYNSALSSGSSTPQYMDEAPATFFVYTGPHYDSEGNWVAGGGQLFRRQVKKVAPAGVLGLVGCCIGLADGTVLGTYAEAEKDRKMILVTAADNAIERTLYLVNNENVPITDNNNQPVIAVIRGIEVPRVYTTWNGEQVEGVRIKDLPDADLNTAYMVRDSEIGGTTRIDEHDVGLQMEASGTNTLRFFTKN